MNVKGARLNVFARVKTSAASGAQLSRLPVSSPPPPCNLLEKAIKLGENREATSTEDLNAAMSTLMKS
jgi:hypothetical protein